MLRNKPFPKQLYSKKLTHCDVCPSASIALKAMRWKDEQILLDDDDKLATEVKVDSVTITPPQGYLIGKVTHVKDSLIVELKKNDKRETKSIVSN